MTTFFRHNFHNFAECSLYQFSIQRLLKKTRHHYLGNMRLHSWWINTTNAPHGSVCKALQCVSKKVWSDQRGYHTTKTRRGLYFTYTRSSASSACLPTCLEIYPRPTPQAHINKMLPLKVDAALGLAQKANSAFQPATLGTAS